MKRTALLVVLTAIVSAVLLCGTPVSAAGKVNINTASKRRLEQLPGVGKDLAELIISYRREVGYFNSVAELKDIPGIGERKFEAIEEVATVGKLKERNL